MPTYLFGNGVKECSLTPFFSTFFWELNFAINFSEIYIMEAKGFGYHSLPQRFVSKYSDGKWSEGALTGEDKIVLSESACVLQYAQTVFEGLKAYRTKDGRIVCFRPDLNAERLADSCNRMKIPPISKELFLESVDKVVSANSEYIPDFGSGGALYLRPFVIGTTAVLGVKPATEFEYRIFASPVGSYFSGNARPITLRVCDFDRAAPHGTGHIKAGLNYAMSLYAIVDAHEKGYDENLYLDSTTRTFVEETGGANVIFEKADGTFVTPKSDTILPSITRRSIVELAKNSFGIKVEERKVPASELKDFDGCGLCGTAAVISPVGRIDYDGESVIYPESGKPDGKMMKLRELLVKIQTGEEKAPEGWLREIKA